MSIPPNRIAVLGSVLTALAGTVVTLLGAVDTLEKAIVMSVFIFAVTVVAVVFLLGWQKHEDHVAHGKPTIGTDEAAALQGATGVTGERVASPSLPAPDPETARIVASLAPPWPGIDGAKLLPDEIPGDLDSARADALAADPPIKPVTA